MKNVRVLEKKIIMENPLSMHNYFAWPTVATLADGRLAVAASGFRLEHVCPFGKAVIAYSEDGGHSFSAPAAVIDTPLDDRDAGLLVCGDTAVLTSFNNTPEFQRSIANRAQTPKTAYSHAYLNWLAGYPEAVSDALGSTFKLSHDGGRTWEPELYHSPVSAPHGPFSTADGRILYIGNRYGEGTVECWELDGRTGEMTKLGELPPIEDGTLPSEEPHGIALRDGHILAVIRTERQPVNKSWQNGYELFTMYQTISSDGGRTWEKPRPLTCVGESFPADRLGAPPHLFRDRDGRLILSAASRLTPFGILIYASDDEAETWRAYTLTTDVPFTIDLGYPATTQTADGDYYTVWYQHPVLEEPAVIYGARWQFE